MSTWVDFKRIREELDFRKVLEHYGVEVKVKGQQAQGFCPLPDHEGKRRSPSFSANLPKGIWQCFGCQAMGNVLDFATLMEGKDPENGAELREVALTLQELFGIEIDEQREVKHERSKGKRTKRSRPRPREKRETKRDDDTSNVVVNAPLDFALKNLDAEHQYLAERGFTRETVKHFGLGHCGRGLMAGRIAIPLHDVEGKLLGYAGRLVDDDAIDEEHPKYLFPGKRERDGKVYEFKKSLFLYHGWQIKGPVDELVVVEGFPSVWWLWQHGCRHVVGLMGASCGDEQAKLIVQAVHEDGRVWVFPDGDRAGEQCAQDVLGLVSPHRYVRWVRLDENRQPTDCDPDELAGYFPGMTGMSSGEEREP